MRKWPSTLMPLAVLAGATLVVVLTAQKRSLQEELEDHRRQLERPHAGLVVPAFTTQTLVGDTVTIGSGEHGHVQLLFAFDTACGFCKRTVPVWNQIAAEFQDDPRVDVFGISLSPEDATRSYVERLGVSFPVVFFPSPRLATLYRAHVIPITAFVDSDGALGYVRLGALDRAPTGVDSILRFGRMMMRAGDL